MGKSILEFPRKSTVRFVVQDGKNIGSGGYKKYDDTTACLQYLHVDQSNLYDEKTVYDKLYSVLENDMITDGFKTIFVLCSNKEIEFYKEKGYIIGENRDYDRVTQLHGARLIFDVTMEKEINCD